LRTEDKIKIYGAVILYNPQGDIIKNINSYLDQIDYLLIMDNSPEKNYKISNYYENSNKVEYLFNNENLGIAKALNIAAENAISLGYNYLLTMDQDSYFESSFLEKINRELFSQNDIGIITPFHKNKFESQKPTKFDLIELRFVKTSGNLLSLKAYREIGPFNENFFIDYVDIEYNFRMIKKGYKILQIQSLILNHNEANLSRNKFIWRDVYPWNHSPERWYYKVRNLLYFRKDFKSFDPSFFKHELIRYIVTEPLKIFFFEKQRLRKLKYILLGVFHFLKKRQGGLK